MDTYQILVTRFPGRAAVTLGEALEALTQRHYVDAEQAAHTLLWRGRYPLPTFKILGRRLVRLADLAAALDGEPAAAQPQPADAPAPRRPGRPRRQAGGAP